MRGLHPFAIAVALVVMTACSGGAPDDPPSASSSVETTTSVAVATAPGAPTTADPCAVGPQQPLTSIAADYATALAFAPDGRLFYAERAGTVRVYQNGKSLEFAKVATVTTEPGGGYSERGLLGLAISPTFARDHYVYAFYSKTNRTQQEVIRWSDCAGVASDPSPLIELPAGSDCCHKGGRLAFGPDGKLYVTLGEQHQSSAAQDTGDTRGKVLRYNADGSVPTDNPFGAKDPVWAFGFRNPFGIAISATGQMAIANNGPTGDAGSPSSGYDTIVVDVARGGGYQWPNCYGYSHPIRSGASCGAGQIGPDWSSETTSVVPTGAAFVDSAGPAGYAGHLVVCTVSQGMLIVTPGNPHAVVSPGPQQCRLDVEQGPDHALYYSDTEHIYRFSA